jgi:hypothetical protein
MKSLAASAAQPSKNGGYLPMLNPSDVAIELPTLAPLIRALPATLYLFDSLHVVRASSLPLSSLFSLPLPLSLSLSLSLSPSNSPFFMSRCAGNGLFSHWQLYNGLFIRLIDLLYVAVRMHFLEVTPTMAVQVAAGRANSVIDIITTRCDCCCAMSHDDMAIISRAPLPCSDFAFCLRFLQIGNVRRVMERRP